MVGGPSFLTAKKEREAPPDPSLRREGSEHRRVNVGSPHGRRVVIPGDQERKRRPTPGPSLQREG